MTRLKIEQLINNELNERTFEEVLEDFDLTPTDVFMILFNNGHIDEEILEQYAIN